MKNRSFSFFLLILIMSSTLAAELTSSDSILDIQKLLSLKGHYEGRIDGLNGPKTEKAILQYEREIGWPLTGQISAQLIERLRTQTKDAQRKAIFKPQDNESLPNVVRELDNRVEALEREWKGDYENRVRMSEKFTENVSDFNKSAFDVAAAATSNTLGFISLIIGFSGAVGGLIAFTLRKIVFADVTADVKKSIDSLLHEGQEAIKKGHTEVLELGKTQVSPRIYTNLGGHYWLLHVATENKNYLDMAITLTEYAYRNTRGLDTTNRDNRIFCREVENNYAYFLARRQRRTDGELALRLARKCYSESETLRDEGEEPLWYEVKETYAYVLRRYSDFQHDIEESNKIIDDLKNNASLPFAFRQKVGFTGNNATSS